MACQMKEQTSRYFLPYDIKIYADIKTNSTDNLIFYIKTKQLEETNSLANKSVDLRTFFHIISKYTPTLRRIPRIIQYFTLNPNSLEETNSLANQSVDLRTFFYIISKYTPTLIRIPQII